MPVPPVPPAGVPPGGALPRARGLGGELASPGVVVAALDAGGAGRRQPPGRWRVARHRARADRLPGASCPAWLGAPGAPPGAGPRGHGAGGSAAGGLGGQHHAVRRDRGACGASRPAAHAAASGWCALATAAGAPGASRRHADAPRDRPHVWAHVRLSPGWPRGGGGVSPPPPVASPGDPASPGRAFPGSTPRGDAVPSLRLALHGGPHAAPGVAGVARRRRQTRAALLPACWPAPLIRVGAFHLPTLPTGVQPRLIRGPLGAMGFPVGGRVTTVDPCGAEGWSVAPSRDRRSRRPLQDRHVTCPELQ
jgi:hypothetical protein